MASGPERRTERIAGPAGDIECLIESHPADNGRRGAAVVCHPHPQHGGTMHNKVAHTLARAALDLGYTAVRFNFRGVGASEGQYDDGRGERDDARAVIAWSRKQFAGDWLLAGFSFGAAVAIEVARDLVPERLVTVAPPVRLMLDPNAKAPECPWLIVTGDADELVDVDEVIAWVDRLPPGPELIVLPGVEHFFHGHLVELRKTLVANLGETAE